MSFSGSTIEINTFSSLALLTWTSLDRGNDFDFRFFPHKGVHVSVAVVFHPHVILPWLTQQDVNLVHLDHVAELILLVYIFHRDQDQTLLRHLVL